MERIANSQLPCNVCPYTTCVHHESFSTASILSSLTHTLTVSGGGQNVNTTVWLLHYKHFNMCHYLSVHPSQIIYIFSQMNWHADKTFHESGPSLVSQIHFCILLTLQLIVSFHPPTQHKRERRKKEHTQWHTQCQQHRHIAQIWISQ